MNQPVNTQERYQALPEEGHIRLLFLQPSANRDAQIECHLSPSQIDERPYEALSYVWGQEEPSYRILVDAEEFRVRSNLYGALKELRLKNEARVLWVDSICINQSDISERNYQVRQMGTIYSSAKQVVVWLGEGDEDTDAAIGFIQGLSKLDSETTRRIVENEGLPWEYRLRVFDALGMKHGIDNHEGILAGLTKLMDHVWWKRVWTVQEIVLARDASMRCGSKSASWRDLSKLAGFALEVSHHNTLQMFGRPMSEACFDEITGEVARLYVATLALNNFSYRLAGSLDINLEQMIWQLLGRQATDPLDVIYALLGLTSEKSTIEIDYRKSKKQVYRSAMKDMLERSSGKLAPLDFLQDCYLERDPSLPSWVPDFGILHSFKTTSLNTSGIGISLAVVSLYCASFGDAGWRPPRFLDDDDVLELEGVLVDEARDLGDVCPRFPSGWERRTAQLQAIIDRWAILVPKKDGEYIGGGSLIEAFWRTITFDLQLIDRDYLAGNPDRRDLRLPRRAGERHPTTSKEEAEIREGIIDAPPPKTVLEKLGKRRFFVTKTGYFGLGPASMQVGDIVCILRGVYFPMVIRPTINDRYAMVGQCFVHGIMDGEMVNSVKNGLSSWQSFSFV